MTKAERRSCEARKKAKLLSTYWVRKVLKRGYYSQEEILRDPYLWRISGNCRRNRRTASVGDHCSWCLSNLTINAKKEIERLEYEAQTEFEEIEDRYSHYDYDTYDDHYGYGEWDYFSEWLDRGFHPPVNRITGRKKREVSEEVKKLMEGQMSIN